jgi:hypothetical protein
LVLLFVILYASSLIGYAIQLEQIRDVTRSPGQGYPDDEWGYGQTTAVLLWAPVLRTAIKVVWRE